MRRCGRDASTERIERSARIKERAFAKILLILNVQSGEGTYGLCAFVIYWQPEKIVGAFLWIAVLHGIALIGRLDEREDRKMIPERWFERKRRRKDCNYPDILLSARVFVREMQIKGARCTLLCIHSHSVFIRIHTRRWRWTARWSRNVWRISIQRHAWLKI